MAGQKRERMSRFCRRNETRLVIVTESHETKDDVFRARDEGEQFGEGDDVGMWRGEEEDGMARIRWMEEILAGTGMAWRS